MLTQGQHFATFNQGGNGTGNTQVLEIITNLLIFI